MQFDHEARQAQVLAVWRNKRITDGVQDMGGTPIDRAARRITDTLFANPALFASKERVAAMVAIELRTYTEELEERFPWSALVIFFGALAAGLVLGGAFAILWGWRI